MEKILIKYPSKFCKELSSQYQIALINKFDKLARKQYYYNTNKRKKYKEYYNKNEMISVYKFNLSYHIDYKYYKKIYDYAIKLGETIIPRKNYLEYRIGFLYKCIDDGIYPFNFDELKN